MDLTVQSDMNFCTNPDQTIKVGRPEHRSTGPTRRALAAQNRCQGCCDACKRLHGKCDNGAPCGTCIQKKRKCTRGRSPSPSSSDRNYDHSYSTQNAAVGQKTAVATPKTLPQPATTNVYVDGTQTAPARSITTPPMIHLTISDYDKILNESFRKGYVVGFEKGLEDGFAKGCSVAAVRNASTQADTPGGNLTATSPQQHENNTSEMHTWYQSAQEQFVEPQPLRQQHARSTGNPGLDTAAPLPKNSKPRTSVSQAAAPLIAQPLVYIPPAHGHRQLASTTRVATVPQTVGAYQQPYIVDIPRPRNDLPWVPRPMQDGYRS